MPEKREQAINFRVTLTEERRLRDTADSLDMSISSFLRQAVMLGAPLLIKYPRLRTFDPCGNDAARYGENQ